MHILWERAPSFNCFFKTSFSVLFSPKDFFVNIQEGGVSLALLYGVIANTTGGLLGLIWLALLQRQVLERALFPSQFLFSYSLLLPLLSVLGILISSLLFHLFLLLLRGANRSFKITLKALSYGQASQLMNAIPLFGPFLATLYGLIIYVIALKEVHRTSYPRASLSVFIPFFSSLLLFFAGLYRFAF